MKIIKPLRVSMLTRPFRKDQRDWLAMSAIVMTDGFGSDARLVPEPDCWKTFGAELGNEFAFDVGMPKATPEFLVTGNAYTHHQQDKTQAAVAVQVGRRKKALQVFGNRFWIDGRPSAPEPFDDMRLEWRHTFGGPAFAENPVGIGHADEDINGLRARRVPNIEDPHARLHRPDQIVVPAGFGAVDGARPSRAARLGRQYDEHWKQHLFPGYARDMDWHYFNAAPQDQWLAPEDGELAGAPFEILNMHPDRAVQQGRLPDWRARGFVVRGVHHPQKLDGAVLEELPLRLTTAWFFPHLERVGLIYHGVIPITEDDATDISHAMIAMEEGSAPPRSLESYREVLVIRCEAEDRALYFMQDEQLIAESLIGPWPELDAEMPPPSPLRRNMQVRADRERQEMIEKARAAGVDTTAYEAAEPPPQKPPTMREVPAFIQKTRATIEAQKQKIEEARASFAAAAAANAPASRTVGFDTSTLMAETAAARQKGPPKLDMWVQMERMRSGSDEMKKMMQSAGEKLTMAYRRMAQHQDAADAMAPEAAAQARAEAERILAGSRDFSDMDLTGADFSGMDLRGTRWKRTLLESADFSGSVLDDADMTEALLARARLVRSSLRGVTFAQANMALAVCENTDFSGARFEATTLDGVRATGCNFTDVAWNELEFENVHLEDCNFERAQLFSVDFLDQTVLRGLRFDNARLHKSSWHECVVENLSFAGAVLDTCDWTDTACNGGIDFSHARLESTCFVGSSRLERCRFRSAVLIDCNLRDAMLDAADFDGARMDNSDFSNASMRAATLVAVDAKGCTFVRSDLTGASLVGANLINANLQKAVLAKANFHRANLFQADLGQCLIDEYTRFDEAYTDQVKTVPKRRQEEQAP